MSVRSIVALTTCLTTLFCCHSFSSLYSLSRPQQRHHRRAHHPHHLDASFTALSALSTIGQPLREHLRDCSPRTAQTGNMAKTAKTRNVESDPSTADASVNEDVEMQDQPGKINGFNKFTVRQVAPALSRSQRGAGWRRNSDLDLSRAATLTQITAVLSGNSRLHGTTQSTCVTQSRASATNKHAGLRHKPKHNSKQCSGRRHTRRWSEEAH
jgi:hypothetical protein